MVVTTGPNTVVNNSIYVSFIGDIVDKHCGAITVVIGSQSDSQIEYTIGFLCFLLILIHGEEDIILPAVGEARCDLVIRTQRHLVLYSQV